MAKYQLSNGALKVKMYTIRFHSNRRFGRMFYKLYPRPIYKDSVTWRDLKSGIPSSRKNQYLEIEWAYKKTC